MFFNKLKTKIEEENTLDNNIESNNFDKKNKLHDIIKRHKVKTILLVVLFLVLSVRLYFSNNRVKNIIENSVYSSLNRKLKIGSLKYSILMPKLYMSDIVFYNSTNFRENKNITLDNLKVKFSLFSLFGLKLKIKEVVVDNLYVDIFANEGGTLSIFDFPPSIPKEEKEKGKPLDLKKFDLLKFKVDIQNIRLNNLAFKLDGISENETNINNMFFSLDDLNFHFDFITKRFKLSKLATLDVLDILDKVDIKLFLADNKNISFKTADNSFTSKPIFDFSINHIKKESTIKVLFKFDVDDTSRVVLSKNNISNFQLGMNIDTSYDIKNKNLNIYDVSSSLYSDTILKIKTDVLNVLSSNPSINLQEAKLDLYLDKIEQVADLFMPDMKFKLNGHIAADIIESSGSVSNIENTLYLSTDDVVVHMFDFLIIEKLTSSNIIKYNYNQSLVSREDVKINGNINMGLFHLTFLPAFENMKLVFESRSSLNGVGSFLSALFDASIDSDARLDIKTFDFNTLDGKIGIKGMLAFRDDLDLELRASSLSLTTLTDNFLRGRLSLSGGIKGRLLSAVKPDLKGDIKNFSYNLDGDISSSANSLLDINANVDVTTGNVELSKLNLSIGNFFNLKVKAMLSGFGLNGAYVKIDNFRIAPYSIKTFLSPNLASIVASMPFEDDINATMSLEFKNDPDNSKMSVTNYTVISVSEEKYNLKEITLNLDTDIDFSKGMLVNIKEFAILSDENNLEVSALGKVSTDISKCDVSYKLALDTDVFYVPFMELGGLLDLSGSLKNGVINGAILANNFYLDQKNDKHSVMYLNDLDMNTPYSFSLSSDLSTIKQAPARYMPLTTPKPNITFKEFRLYLQVPPFIDDVIRIVDFNANLDIKKETILLRELKSALYIGGEKFESLAFFNSISNKTAPREGAIYMPWISLNLNDFSTKNIRYDMRMLGSDINFKYLLPADSRARIDDEKLLVNLTCDIAGIGLSPLNAIRFNTFFFGISKMSTELSKFIIEMIKPINPGIEKMENVVQFGYDPNAVEFAISDNKVNTTFYFRDQNLDKKKQQKLQLVAFEGDKFGLEPMSFSDIISYLEKQ